MARGLFLIGALLALSTGFGVGRLIPFPKKPHSNAAVDSNENAPIEGEATNSPPGVEWLSKIESAKIESIAHLISDAESIPLSEQRVTILRLAFKKWTGEDPQAAWSWVRSPDGAKHFDLFFGEWALHDFDAAIAEAEFLMEAEENTKAYRAMSRALAHWGDPSDFLLWANEMDQKKIPQGLYQVAISRLARNDLEAAKSVALMIRRNPANMNSIRHVADVWSETNPRAALSWAKAIEQRDFSDQAVALVLKKLIVDDPDLAGQEFTQLRNPRMKLGRTGNDMARQLARADPVAGVEWVAKYLPEKFRNEAYQSAVRVGLHSGPLAALRAMETMPEEALTKLSLDGWLSGNQLEQLKILDAQDRESIASERLQQLLLKNLARYDFEAAWEYASAETGGRRASLMTTLFLSPGDAALALEKLGSAGFSETAERALRTDLMNVLSYSRSPAALAVYESLSAAQQSKFSTGLKRRLVSGKVRDIGVEKSIHWAASIRDAKFQEQAYSFLVSEWFSNDPYGLSEWANELPSGPAKEAAALELSQELRRYDPEASFHWAAEVVDDEQRRRLLRISVSNWNQQNPVATRQAIEKNRALTESERAELLEQIQPTGSQ